jgi:putative membrane protein
MAPGEQRLRLVLGLWAIGLLWSGLAPYDRATWLMEVAPVLIVVPILWMTRKRFTPTSLLLALVLAHGLILMAGGKYSYARVPLGFSMQDWFGWTRNNYDKIGHFAQGFVPALAVRELLIRVFSLTSRRLVAFLAVTVCLGISAAYELIEWGAALALGQGADEFLGTQGDPWDTQEDMFMALVGAAAALLTLTKWHDRQIAGLEIPRVQ